MPRSDEWSRRATTYQRPSYRARSNGVTGVMPSGGRVDEQPLKASTAKASPSQTQRRKQDRKKEIKIDDEAERLAFYAKCGPSVRQMPQIFINNQRVGGLAGLQAALAQIGQ